MTSHPFFLTYACYLTFIFDFFVFFEKVLDHSKQIKYSSALCIMLYHSMHINTYFLYKTGFQWRGGGCTGTNARFWQNRSGALLQQFCSYIFSSTSRHLCASISAHSLKFFIMSTEFYKNISD